MKKISMNQFGVYIKNKSRFKKLCFIIGGIILVLVVAIIVISQNITRQRLADMGFPYTTILETSQFIEKLDESYVTSSSNPSVIEGKIESGRGFPGYSFVIYFHMPGDGNITLGNGDKSFSFYVSIDEDKKISIRPL